MKKEGVYVSHPGEKWLNSAIENMKKRTGHTLEEWVAITKAAGLPSRKQRVAWLREHHALGMPTAKAIAEMGEGKKLLDDQNPERTVDTLFSGKKAALRPIYDRLIEVAASLGPDVNATPCSTMVPIRRKHVIVQIKPSTNSRVDLGLALGRASEAELKGTVAGTALIDTVLLDTGGKAKGDRITHRIPITKVDQIDEAVLKWMRRAYELGAS